MCGGGGGGLQKLESRNSQGRFVTSWRGSTLPTFLTDNWRQCLTSWNEGVYGLAKRAALASCTVPPAQVASLASCTALPAQVAAWPAGQVREADPPARRPADPAYRRRGGWGWWIEGPLLHDSVGCNTTTRLLKVPCTHNKDIVHTVTARVIQRCDSKTSSRQVVVINRCRGFFRDETFSNLFLVFKF